MKKISLFLLTLILFWPCFSVEAAGLSSRLSGRILLAVESKGEIWYVSPTDQKRYRLAAAGDFLSLLQKEGRAASSENLKKIPVGVLASGATDTDRDGMSDALESALGTNKDDADSDHDGYADKKEVDSGYDPLGAGKLPIDLKFAAQSKGRIFLQAEKGSKVWYVDPVSLKRYLLSDQASVKALISKLALGIRNKDLAQIPSASFSDGPSFLDLSLLEKQMSDLVNAERKKNGLPLLAWNEEVAAVAREHSANLKKENIGLSGEEKFCNYPIIHHEGSDFGLYHSDRLWQRNVFYFSYSGENVALEPTGTSLLRYDPYSFDESKIAACRQDWQNLNAFFKKSLEEADSDSDKIAIVQSEIAKRRQLFAGQESFQVVERTNFSSAEIASTTVTGWMNSPGHRANILNPQYNEAGIGIAYFDGYIIATQVFIKRVSCGYNGGPCCQEPAGYMCYLPARCQAADKVCRK